MRLEARAAATATDIVARDVLIGPHCLTSIGIVEICMEV